uniref:Carboxylesterase n=1 Tax=uncultured Armatimonadetes bacterium TaxID=157466 RepID=A0A6J4IPI7_9BACT|nr:Carboxylesterase [uncultured Armatimonadetes bacterium]
MDPLDLDFVHRFVPAQQADRPVTLLLLHGTGGSEDDLLPLGQSLLPGAGLLSPRGKVLENGMPRFFRRLAEGVFDEEDVRRRAEELADFVAASAQAYGFDPLRVLAVGYSNGANIAAAVLLLRPETLAGAVLLRPMVPLVPETMPDLSGRPLFLAAGRRDPIVSPAQTEQLAALLRSAGADVTLHWHPGGHGLGQDDLAAAGEWLAQVL